MSLLTPSWNFRILAVDDEPEIAKIYKEILQPEQKSSSLQSSRGNLVSIAPKAGVNHFPFEVDIALSFEDAQAKFNQALADGKPYAMGFFDVRLGGSKDGVQLVRELFDLDPAFMAVFVTAHNDRGLDSFQQTIGVEQVDRWNYLSKPFNRNEVVQQARARISLWNLRREREGQASKLEDLNRRVQESERLTSVAAVARGVAHEFGNLLMQIVGNAEISRDKSPEDMRMALDKIINASQVASDILDRFHNLSDHRASKSEKLQEDVLGLMRGAHDLLAHQFRKHNIEFVFEKQDAALAWVAGSSLLQVFVNLFINAVHALNNQGGQIIVSVEKNINAVTIKVRDTGPGVSAKDLLRISEPFYTTKGAEGTGLGLSICKEIIEIEHHGEFLMGNHPDGGFEIQMTIPLKVEAEVA